MRGFPLALALIVLATPGLAASFDCNKAATPLEYAICGNPDLSRADERMSAAFSAARSRLSKTASAVVLDNQRNWNDFAMRACSEGAAPRTAGLYNEDDVYCLTDLFDSRAYALEQVAPVDGVPVYPVDHFKAVPDPDPDSWSHTAKTVISYAQIDGDDPVAAGFNAFVRDLAEPALNAPPDPDYEGSTDYDMNIALEAAAPRRLSVSINEYFYGHGAAHGNYAITFAHYLPEQNRRLEARDVFASPDWATEAKPLVIARLKQDAAEQFEDEGAIWDDLEGLEDSIGDVARWDIKREGIGFQFQPYEVSAYAYGAPQAVLSWEELGPWLRPGARDLLTGK